MPTPSTIDAHLDDVALKQLVWKPSVFRDVAVRIVEMISGKEFIWPDEVDLQGVSKSDVNCIGSAWRALADKAGIIVPTGQFRRSTKDGSKGRKVFQYRLASASRAKTFLHRNGGDVSMLAPKQQELFL